MKMAENLIQISAKDNITTMRVTQRTKKMLEALSVGKETHEEIIKRLIKLVNNFSKEGGSKIIERGNMIGTKHERLHKTFDIITDKCKYSVVCTFNDITLIAMLKANKTLRDYMAHRNIPEWDLDLEIVNIKVNDNGWEKPGFLKTKDEQEYLLIYLAVLKNILEETFDISIYEINTINDYFTIERWRKSYKSNGLSMESFDRDVQKVLRG